MILYLVIDMDRHRDDLHRLYKDRQQAINDALDIIKKAEKKGYIIERDYYEKDTLNDIIIIAEWCGESYGISVHEVELEKTK